jgi:gliding motility-associated-like protein
VSSYVRTQKDTFNIFLPYAPPGDSTLYQIRLRAKTGDGPDSCSTISEPVNIRIAPTPIASFAVQPTADGCSPLLGLNFLNTSANLPVQGGIQFQWSFGQGRTFEGANPPPQDFVNLGLFNRRDTVSLSLIRGDGCVYNSTRFIIIYPTPRAEITAPDSICSGETVQLEGNGVGVNTYIWQFPDFDASTSNLVSPSKTFTNFNTDPRFYTIRLSVISAANCTTTVEKQIKVNPNPTANFTASTNQLPNCGALQINFRYINPGNAVNYTWSFGNGDSLRTADTSSFIRDFNNETAAPFTQVVQLTSFSPQGCVSTVSQPFTVNPLVRARFTQSADSGCTPLAITLLDSSTAAANVKTWIVNGQIFNNLGQVNTVLRNNSLSDTTFIVRLAVRNNTGFNCRDTMTKTIRVFAKPRTMSLTATPESGCSPVAVTFQNDVLNAAANFWNFGDGRLDTLATTAQVTHTFENPNTLQSLNFNVLRIAASNRGCLDSARVNIAVRPFSKANITTLNDTSGCTPFTVQLASGTSINANSFTWDFGDGSPTSSAANPQKTFINNSDTVQHYRVTLIARRSEVQNCPDTTTKVFTVYPLPVSDFTLSRSEGCGPLSVSMTNNSAGAVSGYWVISAGGLSDTIRRPAAFDTIFVNPNFVDKIIRIEYFATNQFGCKSRSTQFVTVHPNLTAKFIAQTQGCTPLRVGFVNQSENEGGTFYWNFGDGRASTDVNPTHTFTYDGPRDTTYKVVLSSISPVGGCVATDSVEIKVFGRPRNSFDINSPLIMVLPENTVNIQNNTPFRENWRYRWDFEDLRGKTDTSSAENFSFTYNLQYEDFTFMADTIFNITMIARHPAGCADTLVKTIIIKPGKPEADFFANIREGCVPLTVTFRDSSKFGRWYEWEFGDGDGNGGSSFERHPVYTYTTPGQKRVKLTTKGYGGADVEVKEGYINVLPSPSARFTTDPRPPREVIVPEEFVKFSAIESNLSYQYNWNFGDGNTSTERNPNHRYQNPGSYTVSLTVKGENGCQATDTVRNAVLAIGSEYIRTPNVFIPNPLFSNGGVVGSELTQDIFYPQTKGAQDIKIQIFNRWGQVFFQSNQLYRGWDGYVNGKLAPPGTYVYRIEVTYVTGKRQVITGDITLIR